MASMMSWQQRPDQLDPHTQTRAGAGLEGLSHHRTARHGPRHLPPALSVACSWALTGTLILSRPPSSAALSKPHAAHLDVLAVVPLIELHDLILDAELVHGLLGLQFAPSGYRHTDGAKKQCWRACALAQACARCVSMRYASITRRAPSCRRGIWTWKKPWLCCCTPCAECQSLVPPAGARISPHHMLGTDSRPHRASARPHARSHTQKHLLILSCTIVSRSPAQTAGPGRTVSAHSPPPHKERRRRACCRARVSHLRPSRAGRRRQRQRGACRRAASSRPAPNRQMPARLPAGALRTHPPCQQKARKRGRHNPSGRVRRTRCAAERAGGSCEALEGAPPGVGGRRQDARGQQRAQSGLLAHRGRLVPEAREGALCVCVWRLDHRDTKKKGKKTVHHPFWTVHTGAGREGEGCSRCCGFWTSRRPH